MINLNNLNLINSGQMTLKWGIILVQILGFTEYTNFMSTMRNQPVAATINNIDL